MATLKEVDPKSNPAGGHGILLPLIGHRFRIRFNGNSVRAAKDMLSQQVVDFKVDGVAHTITFNIEQPAMVGEFFEAVLELVQAPGTITVEFMDGSDGVMSAIEFGGLESVSHSFVLDYAASSFAVRHALCMKYSMTQCTA